MNSPAFIRVPDDCGTLSVGWNQSLYLVFTQDVNFQCDHANYFNPPLKTGIHGAHTISAPSTPDPQYSGQDVEYTLPGTPEHCPPPAGGQAGARGLIASHVIHIGSGPLVLRDVIVGGMRIDESLRKAWQETKIFVNFLLSQNSLAVPHSAKTFLGELRTAGDEAFDITRKSSE
jgi:hypothetical protein